MKRCMICGGTFHPDKIDGLIQCDTCRFTTTNLDLSQDELKKLYSADYYHGEEYADYLADKEIIQKNFQKRIKRLGKFLKDMQDKTLFEVGCAYGFFLEKAKVYFRETEGIDISEDATKDAREVLHQNAHTGDFATFTTDTKFDVLCMWDTIEHLESPDLYLEKANAILKKDGYICITTGDIGSLNAKIRGRKWRQIHPPTHLHYFSRDTLTKLLERKGFKVEDISYPGNIISVNTALYTIFCLKSNHSKVYNFFKKIGIT